MPWESQVCSGAGGSTSISSSTSSRGFSSMGSTVLGRRISQSLPGTAQMGCLPFGMFSGQGAEPGGSTSSTPRTHATLGLIFTHGFDAAVCFTAVPGSHAVLPTMGMPLLCAALCLKLLPRHHSTVAPLVRPGPPVAGWMRGRPVPRVVVVPVVPLKCVYGLCARGLSSTGVSRAAGAIPPPMTLLHVSCPPSW